MIWLAVAVGGAAGALARAGLVAAWGRGSSHWPWPIFLANTAGALAMGVLYVVLVERSADPLWRPLLMTGFLGALTTFSTFALDAFYLWQTRGTALALGYVVATNAAVLIALAVGITAARWISGISSI